MSANSVPDKWDATRIQSLKNKLAVITGANSGVGYETALELARKGADVVLACRSEAKGAEAVEKIQQELAKTADAGKVEFMKLDVSDLSSVKNFSEEFRKTHERLDLLINNAGIMAVPYSKTVDGLESQMATNHLGHFALTAQLFDVLKASSPSRIVNVSSLAHRDAREFDEKLLDADEKKYDTWSVYANSKLANILTTAELTRRMEASGVTGVTAVTCHPGLVASNLYIAPVEANSGIQSFIWRIKRNLPVYQSAQMGALPTLYAATAPSVTNNQFFGPRGFKTFSGYPTLEDPSKASKSVDAARKMWETSEKLTGVKFEVTK
ncbi:hypothetical protein Poli38472_003754 [Pythium oligandrum]|uniref:Uncharacterized protein n=1 Tax=Pythium oligandrum TaxID=41045 RepID=A0A8K1CMU5_PYTOL|nr:hypothetical protein Poli38472_003754 [Pythium oligandrum]|eukprot:TMW65989.1 hypothetical protein Poli38472_003754 [Pythium oligandrum]